MTDSHRLFRSLIARNLAVRCIAGAALLAPGVWAKSAPAQQVDFERAGGPLKAVPADQQIAAALKQVSSARIKANIERLVQFNNRTTIGSTETALPAGTGVTAAAEGIGAQLAGYSDAIGGRPECTVDSV